MPTGDSANCSENQIEFATRNEKSPKRCRFGLFSDLNNTLAVSYSPTTLRLQYHRRWRA